VRTPLVAFGLGFLFAVGLGVGGMLQPVRVQGFLDVFGRWDPTLAFVMAGAVVMSTLSVRWAVRLRRPLWAQTFRWPEAFAVDKPLLAGAVLFGLGWGLSGLCPGPAIASLAALDPDLLVFVAAMLAGMWLHGGYERARGRQT